MSFALTEPDAGSDSAAVKTRGELVRDGDGDHYCAPEGADVRRSHSRHGSRKFVFRYGGDPQVNSRKLGSCVRRIR